jgi:biopolymer transport protein ExbD
MSRVPLPSRRRKPDFSLTMVNIVFLLLLFYLAAGSLIIKNELDTDIPVTEELPLERLPRPLLLISSDGIFLDGRAVQPAEAVAEVREALDAQRGTGFLNLLADRAMPAGEFLEIVAGFQSAGIPVRVVTLHQPTQPQAEEP